MSTIIMGPPGSGKTYLTEFFTKAGYSAFDTEQITGLAMWVDGSGTPTSFPKDAGEDITRFTSTHRYVWDEHILYEFLSHHTDAYLFGVSSNAFELLEYFDRMYYLDLDDATLIARLQSPERKNPDHFGETPEQIAAILDYANHTLKPKALTYKLRFVDARLSPDYILQYITEPD